MEHNSTDLLTIINWAKFEGIDKEHIADSLEDEAIKHDTAFTQNQLELLTKYGIKLA